METPVYFFVLKMTPTTDEMKIQEYSIFDG